jgi:hypothetical protein
MQAIKSTNYKIIRTQILLLFVNMLVLTVLVLNTNTDTNTAFFGLLLMFPFVIILCVYNGILIKLSERYGKSSVINYLFPIVPILLWSILSNYSLTIRFWKLSIKDVGIGLSILGIVNIFGYYFLNEKEKE